MTAHWNILLTRGVAIFLALLLATELALRWEPIEAYFPPRPYHSDEVELRRLAMRKLQRSTGPIDVLFVGNSSVRTAVSPLVFDRVVANGGRRVLSYNGSLSGIPPSAVNFFLRHFYLEEIQPRIVFEAVTLAALKRPITPERWDALTSGPLEQAWRSEQPLDPLRVFGMRHSRLLYYRGVLGGTFRDVARPILGFEALPMDERGFEPRARSMRERKNMRLEPPYEREALEIDPVLETIRRTAELCRSRGIEYVLVRLPEHASRFTEEALHDAYRERLRAFAARENIRYLDAAGEDAAQWSDDWLFNDSGHLTVNAAREFTALLARAWLASSP